MYKLSRKDSGRLVIFNNGVAVVPALYEDFSADEKSKLDNFIENFNNNYAKDASLGEFMGEKCIYVDANIKED